MVGFPRCSAVSNPSLELPTLPGMLQLPHWSRSQDIPPRPPCPLHSLQKNASVQTFATVKELPGTSLFLIFFSPSALVHKFWIST